MAISISKATRCWTSKWTNWVSQVLPSPLLLPGGGRSCNWRLGNCTDHGRWEKSTAERIKRLVVRLRYSVATAERPADSNPHFCNDADCDGGNDDFVKIMREAQPYFYLHTGSTFVLIISAEVIRAPDHMHSILQVLYGSR